MKMVASPQALASFERVEKGSLKPEDQSKLKVPLLHLSMQLHVPC